MKFTVPLINIIFRLVSQAYSPFNKFYFRFIGYVEEQTLFFVLSVLTRIFTAVGQLRWISFFSTNQMFCAKGCRLEKKKTYNWQTKWIFQKNKKWFFLYERKKNTKTNGLKSFKQTWNCKRSYWKTNFQKITIVFFLEQTIFLEQIFEKLSLFLLKERLYWTNDFTKRSFTEKTNEVKGKWTQSLRTKLIFFRTIEKNEM